jgi:TolA-binding protein
MKGLAVAALALALGTISYALSRQAADEPTGPLPVPGSLLPTAHPPLPKALSHYWFVPEAPALSARDGGTADLARGVRAIAAGEFAMGLPLVSQGELSDSRLADYAKYYQAVALQGLSRLPEADAILTAIAGRRPRGFLNQVANVRLADVALAQDDAPRAEGILRALAGEAAIARDDVLLRLARVEEALDHRDHALDAYREVYFGYPTSAGAVDAGAGLERLEASRSTAPPGLALSRAQRLFAAGRWSDARAGFEPLVGSVGGSDRDLVALRLAQCDFHLGRHRAARDRLRPLLSGSPIGIEARYFHLRAVRGLGDRAQYVALSRQLVAEYPDSPWAAETLDGLASHHIIDDEDEAADRVFRELLDRFPRHRYAERAAWKVGWAAYRGGRFAETVRTFESAATTFPRADYRPAWLYWSGRARDRMGDGREAADRYRLAVTDYGSSYYGRLASQHLAAQTGGTAAAHPAEPGDFPPLSVPPTEALMRALMAAGLHDDALNEVQYAQRTWGDSPRLQATAGWIRHQQAQTLRGDERFAALRGAITTMRRAYPQFLSAAGAELPVEVLRIIFPLDYWNLIE